MFDPLRFREEREIEKGCFKLPQTLKTKTTFYLISEARYNTPAHAKPWLIF